jgi:hypothetical protein
MTEHFACCFCGNTIEPESPDVGSLLYTTDWDKPKELQHDQGLFCHGACLKSRLHPSVNLYVLSLSSKEPLTSEQLAKLPDFLRPS